MGISSSCLFSLGAQGGAVRVRRYDDRAYEILAAHCTEEYRAMLDLAQELVEPLTLGLPALPADRL